MRGEEPQLPDVRCIVWLDGGRDAKVWMEQDRSGKDGACASWRIMNQNREKNATAKCALRGRTAHLVRDIMREPEMPRDQRQEDRNDEYRQRPNRRAKSSPHTI